LSNSLEIAFQIINPGRVKIGEYENEKLNFVTNASLCYRSNNKLTLFAEWNQIISGSGILKLAAEYVLNPKVTVRFGAYGKPLNPSFGLSSSQKNVKIHLAFAFHPYLNTSTGGGLTYSF
jgi:hypothetical protein